MEILASWLFDVFADTVAGMIIGSLVVLVIQRLRPKHVQPVRMSVRKIVGPELSRTLPHTLILTLSGVFAPRNNPGETHDVRRENLETHQKALREGDYIALRFRPEEPSIGHTLRAIETYRSLRRIYLITTTTSMNSVPALRRYVAEKLGMDCEVIARDEYCVSLSDDLQVARAAYDSVSRVFKELAKQNLYDPKGSKVLVDLTGGVRSMQVGALLACLRPEQDVELIGTHYDDSGAPIAADAFPMIIEFEAVQRAGE